MLLAVIATYLFYKPIKYLFKPKKAFTKFVCVLSSVILLSFEFTGLSSIFHALFDNSKPIPKYWFIYVMLLVILCLFLYLTHGKTKYRIQKLDAMDGHRFEYACADILRSNGFKKVSVTQGSGDFGVDIIAYKNGFKYAIQCKRYSNKLNNKPIQEVIGGMAYYGCNKGAVMTNQYFTEPAKELARVNGIELWDRDVLIQKSTKCKKDKTTKANKESVQVEDTILEEENIEQEPQNVNIKSDDNNFKYTAYSTALTNLDKNQKIYEEFITAITENTVEYFAKSNINVRLEKIDIKYETNEFVLEFSLICTKVSDIKSHLNSLAKYVGVKYSEYVYPTSTPYTIGIKMPLPEYLKETSTLVYKLSKVDVK